MKKIILRSAVGIVAAVLVVMVLLRVQVGMADPLFDNIANSESLDAKKSENKFNILLVGVDDSDKRADAIMIINVNKITQKISLLSIPRDTKVKYNGRFCKINSLYADGIDSLIAEIKKLTEVHINYYAVIRPGTLGIIVDSLGGVEVEIEKDMSYSDPQQDLYINLKKGKHLLNGDEAEQYCRYRRYVMGDLERTQAQRNFFSALFEQKLNSKYITKLGTLFKDLEGKISTNVTFNDIMSNIDLMNIISSSSQIECFETPGQYNDMHKEGISYYIIEDSHLEQLKNICKQHFKIN